MPIELGIFECEVPPLRQEQRDDTFRTPRISVGPAQNEASSEQQSIRIKNNTYL